MPTEKPVCGSEADVAEYDFPLHVAAVFIVFFASIGGCGFPVVAKKVKWMKIPPKIFFFCKHFGTGVLIATAFVHLLPTAFTSLNDPCLPDLFTDKYPAMPGVIMMGSLFILFVIEMWLNSKTGGHSHGGSTGEEFSGGPTPAGIPAAFNNPIRRVESYDSEKTIMAQGDEKRGWQQERTYPVDSFAFPTANNAELDAKSEMPPWFIVFYEQYVRQRDEMLGMLNHAMPALPNYQQQQAPKETTNVSYFEEDVEKAVDPLALQKQSMQITLIEGGILFHSVFVGMTISITAKGFVILLIAIVFHQAFEGLGLGSRIAAVPYPSKSWKPWALVVAFGTTAPIGQAIGLITRGSYDPNSAFGLILVGVFNAISSGLLIYAALVDLLAEDFLSEEARHTLRGTDKKMAFFYVILGAMGMSIVGAFA